MKQAQPVVSMLIAVCATSSGHSQVSATSPFAESWEVPPDGNVNMHECEPTERPLVRPINSKSRAEGVLKLQNAAFIAITNGEAARLTVDGTRNALTDAQTIMLDYLSEMRLRKHRAEVDSKGSWSLADEDELSSISRRVALNAYRGYKPYLVRAIAKNEATGGFFAEMCGSDLAILHGSLGRSVPPSVRVPLVIYLKQPPRRVYATWSMAE